MKIFIISQEDSFVIPRNLSLLERSNQIDLIGACVVTSKNSLSNKKYLFIRNFRLTQVLKIGFIFIKDKILNFLDLFFSAKLLRNKRSIQAFCKDKKILFLKEKNVNNKKFITILKDLQIDLIVSFSAPTVFKDELLKLPKNGCINLHCSLLPNYSGILPSFWALYYDEKETGATVHFMDSKIDNGDILAQEIVKINDNDSMFQIIKKTKFIGGQLMLKVITSMINDNIKLKKNKVVAEKYYSWPTELEFKEFSKKRKLI